MEILLTATKVLILYFLLMFISTNLIGLILRGIIPSYVYIDGERYLTEDITTIRSKIVTLLFISATIIYFYLLQKYFRLGVPLAAGLFMLTRIPDLLFEMKTGEKINRYNMPKRKIDFIFNIISWAIIPLLWYSLS